MIKSGPNYWKWPTREDIVDYEFEKVVKIKQQPMYQTEAHFASQNLIIQKIDNNDYSTPRLELKNLKIIFCFNIFLV